MEYLEYTGFTKADRALVWNLFSDFRFWHGFSDVYGDIRWSQGKPWTAGSRMRIEIVRPLKVVVDHVITICSPGEQVAWIDHFLGNTMVQWVTFESIPDGRTRVHTWAEITGSTRTIAGHNCSDLVRNFIRTWYDSFCATCDRLSDGQMVHS
jgi:hypothetical protein